MVSLGLVEKTNERKVSFFSLFFFFSAVSLRSVDTPHAPHSVQRGTHEKIKNETRAEKRKKEKEQRLTLTCWFMWLFDWFWGILSSLGTPHPPLLPLSLSLSLSLFSSGLTRFSQVCTTRAPRFSFSASTTRA
jgi:hypothetical protein